jgi:hypothetical protein
MTQLPNWTKPGFVGKLFKAGAHENFAINRRANSNIPLDLRMQDASLRWEDTSWANLGLPSQPQNSNPSLNDITKFQRENQQLMVECELLLHLLTESEMAKAKKQLILADRKQQLATLLERVDSEREKT